MDVDEPWKSDDLGRGDAVQVRLDPRARLLQKVQRLDQKLGALHVRDQRHTKTRKKNKKKK